MSTIDELRLRANIIKQEEEEGKNTALRVGGLLYDTLNYIESATGGSIPTPSEKTSVVVTPIYSGGTQVARINVDGTNTAIYAPSPTTPTPSYDDTKIKNDINSLNNSVDTLDTIISQEQTRLDGVITSINTTVNEKINTLYNEAKWIQTMFPEHELTWQSGWDAKIEGYLQRVGIWARDNDTTKTQWSDITQKVDEIDLSVNELVTFADDTARALETSINTSIQNGIASFRAEAMSTVSDAQKVIEYMYSALSGGASQYKTWTDIVSAAQNGANNAVAEIRTQIEKVENNDYVASASLASKVNDTIAELYTEADPSSATATLFTAVKKNTNAITTINEAGFVAQSNLDSAVASVIARNGQTTGKIEVAVSNGISNATIQADKINLTTSFIDAITARLTVNKLIATKTAGSVTSTTTVSGDGISMKIGSFTSLEANVTGVGSIAGGVIKWDNSGGGKVTIGKDNSNVEFGGTVTIPRLYAKETTGGVTLNATQGLIITGPDNGTTMHFLNLSGPFSLGGTTLSYTGGDVLIGNKKGLTVTGGDLTTNNNLYVTKSANIGSCQIGTTLTIMNPTKTETQHHLDYSGPFVLGGNSIIFPGGSNVSIGSSTVRKNLIVSGTVTQGSDARIKTIVDDVSLRVEDIASTRAVDFFYKNDADKVIHSGTIAQDWQQILPNTVSNIDGTLYLDYSALSAVSVIVSAREIVALKEKVRLLEERLERLENANQ